jgi:hypothetical protein
MMNITAFIDFRTCSGAEKNPKTFGRMPIARYLNINEILDVTVSKNVIWIAQNTKLMCKRPVFLLTTYCYSQKIFVITPSFQKQTP